MVRLVMVLASACVALALWSNWPTDAEVRSRTASDTVRMVYGAFTCPAGVGYCTDVMHGQRFASKAECERMFGTAVREHPEMFRCLGHHVELWH